jgi:hypothetical protein
VLTPPQLVQRHAGYRNRVLMAPRAAQTYVHGVVSTAESSRLRNVAAAVGAFLISGCTVAKIQEPHYVTQVRDGIFEVRSYGPRVVAETKVDGDWNDAGSEGFRRLAGYIFGKNRRDAKIAMTAPVAQAPQTEVEQGIQLPMTAPVAQQRQGTRGRSRSPCRRARPWPRSPRP